MKKWKGCGEVSFYFSSRIKAFSLMFLLTLNCAEVMGQQAALDKSLGAGLDEGVTSIFRDMGVVQRRAMPKSGRFLFYNSMGFDFSDGPYSMYALNVNPGFAFTDFFEVYINFVPYFVHRPRKIVDTLASYGQGDSETEKIYRFDPNRAGCNTNVRDCIVPISLAIDSVKPKYQYGLEFLWAPLYGKDSLGLRSILRSDTFVKGGLSQILFDNNEKGWKGHLGVGKTFFTNKWLGLRVSVNGVYQASIITTQAADAGTNSTADGVASSGTGQVKYGFFAFFEAGLVIYL
jgi:hypothetical protein